METPPPEQTPAAPPPPPESPSGGPSGGPAGGWSAPPPAQPVAGASGFVYADVPNRAIAYIIDAIILFVINIIVSLVIGAILGPATRVSFNSNATDLGNLVTADVNYATVLVTALVSTAINGVYFIWTWTQMRGSLGQKLLSMQVGNEGDGKTLTTNQAVTRWIFLGAPFGIAGALNPIPALGIIIAIAALAWFIALLVTTAQSPTKQGLHDRYAHTMVVKAARTVG
jgi:uncharacterized RDD family membrane protein YckC